MSDWLDQFRVKARNYGEDLERDTDLSQRIQDSAAARKAKEIQPRENHDKQRLMILQELRKDALQAVQILRQEGIPPETVSVGPTRNSKKGLLVWLGLAETGAKEPSDFSAWIIRRVGTKVHDSGGKETGVSLYYQELWVGLGVDGGIYVFSKEEGARKHTPREFSYRGEAEGFSDAYRSLIPDNALPPNEGIAIELWRNDLLKLIPSTEGPGALKQAQS